MLKLVPVGRTAALLVGDQVAATNFCERLENRAAGESLGNRLEKLDSIFGSTSPEFSLIVPHLDAERPCLISYSTRRGIREVALPAAIVDGSLDANYHLLIKAALAGILEARMKQRFTAEEEHVAMLSFLQLLSTFELLPEQDVGGAFLGARVGASVTWPPPISFYFCDPPTLAIMENATMPTLAKKLDGVARVRTRAEDRVGVVSSSITQRAMLLRSPREHRSDDLLARIALRSGALSDFANDKYCAFINRQKQRVIITINNSRRFANQFRSPTGERIGELHGSLVAMLTAPMEKPGWEIRLLSFGARGRILVRGVQVHAAPGM